MLSIQEVALTLDVSVHALSQTINSQEQKTFYDFVNGYRVDHLKKLLADPQNHVTPSWDWRTIAALTPKPR